MESPIQPPQKPHNAMERMGSESVAAAFMPLIGSAAQRSNAVHPAPTEKRSSTAPSAPDSTEKKTAKEQTVSIASHDARIERTKRTPKLSVGAVMGFRFFSPSAGAFFCFGRRNSSPTVA